MNSNISGIHLWGCWFSERLFTVPRHHPSCCHLTYQTLTVPLPMAAMSLNELHEPNVHTFPLA